MNDVRYLTAKESLLLSRTAECLLRLADVEFNLGEHVLALLKQATLRQADCRRDDIASIDSTIRIQMVGCSEELEFTLVCPDDADAASRRVSILTPLGLCFLGRTVGAVVQVPLVSRHSRPATLLAVWRSASFAGHPQVKEVHDAW